MAEFEPSKKQGRIALRSYSQFLPEAKEAFIACLKDAKLYNLNRYPQRGTPVSSLTAVEDVPNPSGSATFLIVQLDDATKQKVMDNYINKLFHRPDLWDLDIKRLPLLFTTFEMEVIKSLEMLDFQLENEAEVRFSYGDALTKLLRCLNSQFRVRLECLLKETSKMAGLEMKKEGSHSRRSLSTDLTEKSRMDYSLFRVIDGALGYIVFIMEVKYATEDCAKITRDAIAQAIGYYAACTAGAQKVPVVCVLIENRLHLVTFPFTASDGSNAPLLNAVVIPFLPFDEESPFYPSIGCIVASLCNRQRSTYTFPFDKKSPGAEIRKRVLSHLVIKDSVEEMRLSYEEKIEKLEEKEKELTERVIELEEQLKSSQHPY